MSAPTMQEIEKALHTWATFATGLPNGHVIWRNQNGPRPRPFVTLKLADAAEVGQGYTIRTKDNTPAPGQNLTYSLRNQERWRLSFDALTDETVGNNTAANLLRNIKGVARLPYVRDLLRAASIGISSFGSIIVLDQIENRVQQLSRATLDCVFYTPTEFVEKGNTIEQASAIVTETT